MESQSNYSLLSKDWSAREDHHFQSRTHRHNHELVGRTIKRLSKPKTLTTCLQPPPPTWERSDFTSYCSISAEGWSTVVFQPSPLPEKAHWIDWLWSCCPHPMTWGTCRNHQLPVWKASCWLAGGSLSDTWFNSHNNLRRDWSEAKGNLDS